MENKYNLILRVENFGRSIIKFSKSIPRNNITLPLISQLVRAGTSIGANYYEADDAESRNDYKHKVGISKKEARETTYWLTMIIEAEPQLKDSASILYQEAKELNLIMNAIIKKITGSNTKS